jgi:exodeoxyribonuclease V gamma subunit
MPWLSHLALCAAGHAIGVIFVAADQVLRFPAVSQQQACAALGTVCESRRKALDSPLPVAFKTSMAYLSALKNGTEKALVAAAKCFEGDDYSPGEVLQSQGLARTWPAFPDMEDFVPWTEHLYSFFHHSVSGKNNDEQTS